MGSALMAMAIKRTVTTVPAKQRRWGHTIRKKISPEMMLGTTLLSLVVLVTIFAPWITRYGPNQTIPGMSLQEPSSTFWFGTDSIGRDVLTRVFYGGQVSLRVAGTAVTIATVLGLSIGLPAGFFGGKLDTIAMRVLDMFFAFPAILLAITIISIFGSSLAVLSITIGVLYMPRMARIVRAPTMSVVRTEYVEAARAIGGSNARLISRHVLPNVISPVIVEISLALGQVILTETALSFLGLGVPPPSPTWGAMLSESRAFMTMAPWTVWAPGLAIILAVASFLLLGHGLRHMLYPRGSG